MMLSNSLFQEYAELKAKHQKELDELRSRCQHEYYSVTGVYSGYVHYRCRNCGNIAVEYRQNTEWGHLVFGKLEKYEIQSPRVLPSN